MWILGAYFGGTFLRKVRLQNERIQEAMAEQMAREAAHAEGQALPQVLQDFTPFAKVPDVSAIFEGLDARTSPAAKQVQNEKASELKSRRAKRKLKKRQQKQSEKDGDRRIAAILLGTGAASTSAGSRANASAGPTFSQVLSETESALAEVGERFVDITNSKVDEIAKFRTEVSEAQPKLSAAIDAFCSQKGIIKTCDAVLAASGSGFEGVYLAVWNLVVLVEGSQLEVYIETVRPLKMAAEDGPGRGQAKQMVSSDLAELYIQAAEIKHPFDKLIKSIGQATGAEVSLPGALKRISRAFEKMLFDCNNAGSCENIADIIRAMLTATSMKQVAKIALAFLESDEIVIVRIKDRFVEKPSPGGWRDLMINFYFTKDPNRHVCEVQVVLEKMLVARKGLGGHHGYLKSRNALEILEFQDVVDPAKRWEHAAYLRDVPCVDAPELLHLGYEVKDLLKAGYEEMELRDQEGVTEDELAHAREAIALESRRKKSTRRARSHANSNGNKRAMAGAASDALQALAMARSSSKVAPDH